MGSEPRTGVIAPAHAPAVDGAATRDALAGIRLAVYYSLAESHELMQECQAARGALQKTVLWSQQLRAK